MANRLALVVDDSRTARVTLQHMLERQGLDVDTLESAQDALHYLVEKVPDVIFMDHMMPGMDGFQAVEAIKNNPATATIPIMMFTSKGGDLYLSQARALGAVGILPKEVQPAELFQVLNNLGLVKDRRSRPAAPDRSAFQVVDNPPEIAVSGTSEDIQEIARKAAEYISRNNALNDNIGGLLEENYNAVKKEIRDLRHRIEQRILNESADTAGSSARLTLARTAGLLVALALVGVMLAPAIWLYRQDAETRQQLDAARVELDHLRTQQQQAASASDERASLQALLAAQNTHNRTNPDLLYRSIAWAINQASAYDIHEEPFSDRRLAMLYELITRLQALGFKGVVQLHSYLGEFCLAGNDADGYKLAPPDTPIRDCATFGHPLQQLPSVGERQSIGFANFLATSPLVNGSGIKVQIISHQFSTPRLEYPSRDSDIMASEWNRIAAANNRVEVKLVPAPSQKTGELSGEAAAASLPSPPAESSPDDN
jgi:CheY-like chemotaxis protein